MNRQLPAHRFQRPLRAARRLYAVARASVLGCLENINMPRLNSVVLLRTTYMPPLATHESVQQQQSPTLT